MVLYEANFIKLNQLVCNLHMYSGDGLSCCADDCDLHLSIEERTKYTCQIRLTYIFDDVELIAIADPDLCARVYFDARMVEVKGWVDSSRHELLRMLGHQYQRTVDLCWTRNIMLSKWLDYLLEQGHYFPPKHL